MSSEEISAAADAGSETSPGTSPGTGPEARAKTDPQVEASAEPAFEDEPEPTELDLTEPKAMRALAHPVRMALLELIEVAGTLTATQASELLGESPANCAFHLRTLGKYGFIAEAGGGKGRERPWKIASSRIRLSMNQDSPSASMTARTVRQIWLDRVFQRARQILGSDERPEGWHDAEKVTQTVEFLTEDELTELTKDIREVLDRYENRQGDVAKRPEGSLPIEILFFAYPLSHLAELATNAPPEEDV